MPINLRGSWITVLLVSYLVGNGVSQSQSIIFIHVTAFIFGAKTIHLGKTWQKMSVRTSKLKKCIDMEG